MALTIEHITTIPITNIYWNTKLWEERGKEASLNEWYQSIFNKDHEYAFSNFLKIEQIMLLLKSTAEVISGANTYCLSSRVEYLPDFISPPKFYYFQPGDKISLVLNGIDEEEVGEAVLAILKGNEVGQAVLAILKGIDSKRIGSNQIWKNLFRFWQISHPDEAAISERLRIVDRLGLHARASTVVARKASQFISKIYILKDELIVNVCDDEESVVDLMMLAAAGGSLIEIAAIGSDAKFAVEALSILMSDDNLASGYDQIMRDKHRQNRWFS